MLLIGPDVTGKSFLAKKLESMLVAEGRHAYLLGPENLRHGLDADLQDGEGSESVRRYGEVARLLIDTGLLVISTTNAFNLSSDHAVQAIRTLVHPAPVLTVFMSQDTGECLEESDLAFMGPEDFDAATRQIIETLKHKGILAQAIGAQPAFQFSI